MITETLSTDKGKDMTTVQSTVCADSKVLSLSKDVFSEGKVGAVDGHNEELVKSDDVVNTNKKVEETASFQDESRVAERFVSMLDKRRMERKNEADEYEWEPLVKIDAETVPTKVDNLLGKLRKRFSEEKQIRADTTKPSYSQYIFSNSVDSFLRHHEKPKVDIHYSETDGGGPGEGLYSFAVRPSRIRKRKIDTMFTPQKNANVSALSPSNTRLKSSVDDGFQKSTRISNTVSAMQNTDVPGDVLNRANTVICKTPSVYKASDFTVSVISESTTPQKVNSHVLSKTDNIRSSETVSGYVVPPIDKMLVFAELLPIIDAIAVPPDLYFLAIAPIYKVQSSTNAYSQGNPSMLEYRISDIDNGYIIPAVQRETTGHAIPLMLEYHSSHINDGHAMSPFQRITLRAEINGLVYKIDMLVNMIRLKRRTCKNSKHSLYKDPKSIETNGNILRLIQIASADKVLCDHSGFPFCSLNILGEAYGKMIQLICAFRKIGEDGTEKICEMPIPKQLGLINMKEIYGHALPPIRYMFKSKEPKSCVATPISRMSQALEMYGQMISQIYEVVEHTHKERYDKTVSSVMKRATLQEIHDKVVNPAFKDQIAQEIYDHMVPPIYKPASEKAHDHEKVPIDDVSTLRNIPDNTLTADSNYHTVHGVHETTLETIIDEYDDDSPFGILSIYCNSEIHSSCGKMLGRS